jgi:integrase
MRQVLSAALTRAAREELISRNVARLAELPAWEPGEVRPWSVDEALAFLRAARPDPLYPAFVLLLLYGMRRGEVLGLRWQDIDLHAGQLAVRQQIQRIRGSLHTGPVKTRAGSRDLPIPNLARAALVIRQHKQAADREAFGRAWQDTGLVFTTRSGRPVEPRNPGPVVPPDLRPPQDPRHQGPPPPAHHCLAPEEAARATA